MSNEYLIRHVEGSFTIDSDAAANAWADTQPLTIDNFPWDVNGCKPNTTARLFYTDEAFFVRFEVQDGHILAVNTLPNGPVCQDSCVEWFVNPSPDTCEKYINIEINPLGTMLIGLGKDRSDRIPITGDLFNMIQIRPRLDTPNWRIDYSVPFAFFEALAGPVDFGSGSVMKGNCYKCGDHTKYPHYGSWNPVTSQNPDFHRPECFGDFLLE